MVKNLLSFILLLICSGAYAQSNPAITEWLQNTSITGTYYVENNSTAIDNNILVNCQQVEYSDDFAYISTTGVPAFPTGPFLDNNPSNATDQEAIFKIPLNPVENTGTPTTTTGGNIGVFVNGVSLFDYRDGVAWNTNTNALCGGPGNSSCPGGPLGEQDWNRDAVLAEIDGFDCSKAHPAMGNYHHHQNPSAFKLDLNVLSTICNLYDADGLYAINPSQHSPLIGFTYDGFPIYGAYGYQNENGSGGVTRIKSGYELRNITERTEHADGTDVDDGPDVSTTYPLGYFREDYVWINHSGDESYLDDHNGRFAVTPEYPAGTYAYFATVDANHNSAYPYVVGPSFYGVYENRKVTTISEATTIYNAVLPVSTLEFRADLKSDHVLLSWSTATETNNDFFTLERSSDGFNFNEISRIKGAGTSTKIQQYSYQDKVPFQGTVYYRLKQTDFDGQNSYGKTLSVQSIRDHLENIKVYPNPSSEFIAIQMSGLIRNTIEIKLFDLKGSLVKSDNISPGRTINYLDTQTIYNGTYILQINDGVDVKSMKIIIQHD